MIGKSRFLKLLFAFIGFALECRIGYISIGGASGSLVLIDKSITVVALPGLANNVKLLR